MVIATVAAMAQITTSSISGKVIDDLKEEVIGATVVVMHVPTGTVTGTITNSNGRYNISGLKAGGPYEVKITFVGYEPAVFQNITIPLGETYVQNAALSESASILEDVVVTGSSSKFATEKMGAATTITLNQIANLPTVDRSVKNIIRTSPYSNGVNMSIAGGDGRSTNFTVDGANFNNNFGLSDALPGGGNPISMDALEEMQVVVSPFDVRQSNFVGGGVNAVTKSGTNTFKGSAYTYQRSNAMVGHRADNTILSVPENYSKQIYGGTIGGPIIKNKLFFFASFEKEIAPNEMTKWRASSAVDPTTADSEGKHLGTADASNYISRTSLEDMAAVSQFVKNTYGYNVGSYTDYAKDDDNVKFLARLDWNITQNHHLAIRYNYTKNSVWNATNGNSVDVKPRIKINRLSAYSMAFANACYSMDNEVSTVSLDLNSRISDQMRNQLLVTYTNIEDLRGSDSDIFPFIDIQADGGTTPYMSLGYELFTFNNGVHNKILTVKDDFTWNLGNHNLLFGLSYEHQMADNAYMRGGTGYYRFATLEDFYNANIRSFSLTYGYNGESEPAARVNFNQFGVYAQDRWNISENFNLTYGVRLDILTFDEDDIMTNNAIKALDYNGKHVDTGKWPSAKLIPSPRVGFAWDVFGDKSLKVRGGTGLFTGRLPLVFFTNMPTNSGMVQNTVVLNDGNANLSKLVSGGKILTNTAEMLAALGTSVAPTTISPEQGQLTSTICGIDEDFHMPMVWKNTIAADYALPIETPVSVSAEYILTKTIYGTSLTNWNIKSSEAGSWERFSGADNRLIYPTDYKYTSNDAYVLTNTNHGYGHIFTASVNAQPVPNLNLNVAYTHTVSKEYCPMPGSSASSVWNGRYTVDGPNMLRNGNSAAVIPDRLIASVNWTVPQHKEGWATHYTLFYQGSAASAYLSSAGLSSSGYSFVYTNDMNGDGNAYDLIYIPKTKDELNFTSDEDREAFWAFVNQDKYLKKHKGEYAESYGAYAPWVHTFDFRIAQDFGVKTPKGNLHKLTVSLDFTNFGNLLNSKWGTIKTMSEANSGAILKYEGKDANNVPTYSMWRDSDGNAPTHTWSYDHNYEQTWKIQLGFRYTFN